MEFVRAHLPNPIEAQMEPMDLHLGCVMRLNGSEPARRVVAIMLQPPDALLIEKKAGTLLDDWAALYEVIAGLEEQGEVAWGPPPNSANRLILALGGLHGILDTSPTVTQMARENQRLQGHLANLRDTLTEVLARSGFEKPAPEHATLKHEAMRELLDDLRTARPLLLYGDQWIAAIERVLAMKE